MPAFYHPSPHNSLFYLEFSIFPEPNFFSVMGLFFYPPHPISYILPLLLFFLSSHLSSDSLLFFSLRSCVYSSILTTILFFLSAFLHVFKRSFFYPTHIVPFLSLLFFVSGNSFKFCCLVSIPQSFLSFIPARRVHLLPVLSPSFSSSSENCLL